MVGIQRTIVRSCDDLSRLIESNLYIEVLSNTYPDFVREPETSFVMNVNDVFQYQLPSLVDPEGNDEPEVYIDYMIGQRDKYPEFLTFNNTTAVLNFNPNEKRFGGRTYYFTIVAKEKNSDSVRYSFYATCRVMGLIDESTDYDGSNLDFATQVSYDLVKANIYGEGEIKFSLPIHMKWLEENASDFFRIYWTDPVLDMNMAFIHFSFTEFSEDGLTVKFKFAPNGESLPDNARIRVDVDMTPEQYGVDYGLWLGDPETYKLANTESQIQIIHRLADEFNPFNELFYQSALDLSTSNIIPLVLGAVFILSQ